MKIQDVSSIVSTGYPHPPDPVPAYWHELAAVAAPEHIIAEFSPDVFWSFPRAHLVRFEASAANDQVCLQFPLATLTIKAGSTWQRNTPMDAILAGKCSVLVALTGKTPANLCSAGPLPHPKQPDGSPNSQVVFMPQMSITTDFPLGPEQTHR